MSADLPPSSSCSFLMFTVDASMMRRPVSVDPVKAMRSTSGCAASAWPASLPRPVTTLMTPAGTPASCRISATRSTDREASSDGFSTAVHPLASTAPMIQNWLLSGPFHGMIPPMTPTGAFNVMVVTFAGDAVHQRLTGDVGGLRGEERQHLHQGGLGVAQPRDRGTHVHGLDLDQFLEPLVEDLRDAGQQRLALVRGPGTPLALERLACSDDCTINVGLITGSEPRQDLTGRRIDGGQCLPRCGRDALAVDDEVVHLAGQETLGLLA